jgi:ketosteroid isomerase-like protein
VDSRRKTFAGGVEVHQAAKVPNDLEKIFVERANAGDVDGLVALYETEATLVCGDGVRVIGTEQIRAFFTNYLLSRPRLSPSEQSPALCNGDVALTSSRHANGDISAEIARRQADGHWLWAVDQFSL